MQYQLCAKHDKLFLEGETKCPGCETERLKGPDDTLAELRQAHDEGEKKNPEAAFDGEEEAEA